MTYINSVFWKYLDQLVKEHRLVIDRPKGSAHPRYPEMIYPLDYGYLEGTTASDGQGIDVWIGTMTIHYPTAVACTIDLSKKDLEIKILIGCSEQDIVLIASFLNSSSTSCMIILREVHL